MKTPNSVNIPNPCSKKYSEMIPIDKTTKLCTHCSTKVYDFTNASEDEILAIFEANSGNVCAMIQTEEVVTETPTSKTTGAKWKTLFFSFLTFIGLNTSSCTSSSNTETLGEPYFEHKDEQSKPYPVGKIAVSPDTANTDTINIDK